MVKNRTTSQKANHQMTINQLDPYDKAIHDFVEQHGAVNKSQFLKRCVEFYMVCHTGRLPGGQVTLPFFFAPQLPMNPHPIYPVSEVSQIEQEEPSKDAEDEAKKKRAGSSSARQWLKK
ncbi:hypothetical protein SAMN04487866_12211 [Thermoactinomyces sp. DSM 45891]|uniref:hypothetical protein n=1 Tax=Thermoactinomyces sp. DSM 45891 TaxID=1761907 RepID=UPI00091BDE9F|nr:hypothetical protein [Thermoactinomyces sp. DSM 45891]SFX74668.1 hypothetical protein SAMN04487866_12211 [Thermoactinomyces sp. DSM 45891]